MKTFNEIIVGTITKYSGTTDTDKNGEEPIMIQCVAGKMPNRNTLSGTVGKRAGFEIGKTYLINVRKSGEDEQFGEDFTWLKMQEITSPLDVIKAKQELGEAQIITIERPENYPGSYERLTNKVVGVRTKRQQEGMYVPVNARVDAPEIEKTNKEKLFGKDHSETLNK